MAFALAIVYGQSGIVMPALTATTSAEIVVLDPPLFVVTKLRTERPEVST
jgi:hypothetical protein